MAKVHRKTKGTPDNTDKHVGQRLRVRRALLGMSQEKLAEAIGLTFQQIQKYERGTNRISAGRLYQFSKILDVPISFFYDQFGEPFPGDTENAYGMSDNKQEGFDQKDLMQQKETLDLVRSYYSIPDPKLRKEIQRFIKSMASRISDDD